MSVRGDALRRLDDAIGQRAQRSSETVRRRCGRPAEVVA
jgi:hypothetical protein